MGVVDDREYNLDGWGDEKNLVEGNCGHCHRAVAFKSPDGPTSLVLKQVIRSGEEEDHRRHFFVIGICPRPRCQEATIVYRVERSRCSGGYRSDPEVTDERVIFPATSLRPNLPEEVPADLRELHREAASIENLSPNGCAFLCRRILEQALRDYLKKPRAKLYSLIEVFLKRDGASEALITLMHDIREFGNIAGHPARDKQGSWTNVDLIEASFTLDVVAELLEHIYVKPIRRGEMRERWQAKKRGDVTSSKLSKPIILAGREEPPSPPDLGQGDDYVPF